MLGHPVDDPERWSGIWEEARPNGGAVGVIFELITTIRGAATTLQGVPQYDHTLNVGVFNRHGPEIEQGEANYFSADEGYFLRWDGERLHIGVNERLNDQSSVTVNLRYNRKAKDWTGYIRRKDFAGLVTLRRPHVARGVRASAIVGTWAHDTPVGPGCVHVVQHRDGSLTGWADLLQTPGLARYGNGLKPPETTFERYGHRVKVAQLGANLFSIKFNSYSGGCCPQMMFAKVNGGTAQFIGDALTGGVQWTKMSGDTCRSLTQPQQPALARPYPRP